MNRVYNCQESPIPYFNGMSSHIWDPEIDAAIIEIVEIALPYMQKIMGGELPADLEGLLGCWSWMDGENLQICLLMDHAKHKRGYYIAHEGGHLLHYSIRPDFFTESWDKSDLHQSNLAEMIAHAAGLYFAYYAPKITEAVNRLESMYLEKELDKEFLLDQYYFSEEEDDLMDKTHSAGYKAAEYIVSNRIDLHRFVEMDVQQAEKELKRLGYDRDLRGLENKYLDPILISG